MNYPVWYLVAGKSQGSAVLVLVQKKQADGTWGVAEQRLLTAQHVLRTGSDQKSGAYATDLKAWPNEVGHTNKQSFEVEVDLDLTAPQESEWQAGKDIAFLKRKGPSAGFDHPAAAVLGTLLSKQVQKFTISGFHGGEVQIEKLRDIVLATTSPDWTLEGIQGFTGRLVGGPRQQAAGASGGGVFLNRKLAGFFQGEDTDAAWKIFITIDCIHEWCASREHRLVGEIEPSPPIPIEKLPELTSEHLQAVSTYLEENLKEDAPWLALQNYLPFFQWQPGRLLTEDVAALIGQCVQQDRGSGFDALLQALREIDRDITPLCEVLDSTLLRGSRISYSSLRVLLDWYSYDKVVADSTATATLQRVPLISDIPPVRTFSDCVSFLARHAHNKSDRGPLFYFLELCRDELKKSEFHDEILEWEEITSASLGKPSLKIIRGEASRSTNNSDAQHLNHPVLQIQVDLTDTPQIPHYRLRAWVWEHGKGSPLKGLDSKNVAEDQLVAELKRNIRLGEIQIGPQPPESRMWIELVLPFHLLDMAMDEQDSPCAGCAGHIGWNWPVLLRPHERLYQSTDEFRSAHKIWQSKWKRLLEPPCEHDLSWATSPESYTNDFYSSLNEKTIALAALTLDADRAASSKALFRSLIVGLPAAFWLRGHTAPNPNKTKKILQKSVTDKDRRLWPNHVQVARRDWFSSSSGAAPTCKGMHLLWDDPSRIPPVEELLKAPAQSPSP